MKGVWILKLLKFYSQTYDDLDNAEFSHRHGSYRNSLGIPKLKSFFSLPRCIPANDELLACCIEIQMMNKVLTRLMIKSFSRRKVCHFEHSFKVRKAQNVTIGSTSLFG